MKKEHYEHLKSGAPPHLIGIDCEVAIMSLVKLVEQSAWISVDDRLPIQKQSNRSVPCDICINGRTVVCGVFDEGDFYLEGEVIIDNVTHWKNRPEPPK